MLKRRGLLIASPLLAWSRHGAARAGRTWRVAPGESLAAAVAQAADGDIVELQAGLHRAQAAVIEQQRLTLRSVGGPALLQAEGAHAEGKALLVVRRGEVLIEGLQFRGARVRDGNGAGIRFERGRLTVRDCEFSDNQMGLLTGNDGAAELTVERCRFADAPLVPPGAGLTHLLYVGRIARFTLRGSRLAGGRHGHLVKSRAAQCLLQGNRLGEGAAGSGEASYELDLANGGLATLEGNVLLQGAASPNRTLLAFGAEGEGAAPRPHSLVLRGNSFVNLGGSPGTAVRLFDERLASAVGLQARDNLYLGALRVPPALAERGQGNASAPLAAADIEAGRYTLRGRRAPPGAQPE